MPITAEDAPGTLPAGAKAIFVGAFNGAYKGSCANEGDHRDECASKIAWAAVKKKYSQSEGSWVAKSESPQGDLDPTAVISLDPLVLLPISAIVTKASASDGAMRWVARASDTFEDDFRTHMTEELFENFILHSETLGITPYLSIAHYGALDGSGIAGTADAMWIDGDLFKAKGRFKDSSVGRALFATVMRERNDPSTDDATRVRTSIGFLDLKHTHGDYVFERRSITDVCPICDEGVNPDYFLDGVLIHFAATRVPVNQRTSLMLEARSKLITTRFQDAVSIIGEDLADRLELLTTEQSEERSDMLVVKAKAGSEETVSTEESRLQGARRRLQVHQQKLSTEDKSMSGNTQIQEPPVEVEEEVPEAAPAAPAAQTSPPSQAPAAVSPSPAPAPAPMVQPSATTVSAVQLSQGVSGVMDQIDAFRSNVVAVLEGEGSQKEKLERLQPAWEQLSKSVVTGAAEEPDPSAAMFQAFSKALAEQLGPLVQSIGALVGQSMGGGQSPQQTGRVTYSHVAQPTAAPQAPAQGSIKEICRRSVGLPSTPE